MEDLGGAKVHCRKSGVGDLEVKDDAECIEAVKRYLSYFPANCEQKPPIARDRGPGRPDVGEAARHRPRVGAPPVRHVRGDPRDRRRRRDTSTSSRSSRRRSSPASRASAASRSGSSPASRSSSAASSRTTRPTRRRASSTSATPSTIPLRLPPGRARVHGRLEGRARRDHPPRGEDALRDLAGDGAEDHRRRPQGLRRRLLRDERQGLRARPDRRLADAPRSR